MPAAIDPPIIVTGGGGDTLHPVKKAAENVIEIECSPRSILLPKKFRTRINQDAEIKSVVIEFPNMPGQTPITITGYDVYNIHITFNTGPALKRTKSKKDAAARKGKKAAAKRPAARKKGKK